MWEVLSCTFWHLHFQHIGANTARAICVMRLSLLRRYRWLQSISFHKIGLYPCVFATAFQWSIFCGAQGFNCATIFNSNNYRQFSSSFAEVYLNKDPSFRPKMKFFGCTLLFYHFGVVYVYLILKAFSSYAILSGLLPLVVAAVMIHLHRKELAVAKVE